MLTVWSGERYHALRDLAARRLLREEAAALARLDLVVPATGQRGARAAGVARLLEHCEPRCRPWDH